MPKITNADLTSNSPVIKGDEGVWDAKLNYITELTEDKLNEIISDINYVTGISSIWKTIDVQTFSELPLEGQPLTLYYVISENKRYMWGGSVYVDLNSIGDVILNKSDVGLSNVDNTSDITKATITNYSALNTTNKTLTGAINEVKSVTDLKAPTASPTFTGTVTLPSTRMDLLGDLGRAGNLENPSFRDYLNSKYGKNVPSASEVVPTVSFSTQIFTKGIG